MKINGTAMYGIDLDVPNMVHAAIIACPVFGGTVKSVDERAIAGRRGVMQVVRLKDAVAVIADRHWRAQTALDMLPIEWEVGASGATDSAQFRKAYLDALDDKGAVAHHDGDVDAAMATAGRVIEATYDVPIIAHAPMEPLNAIAQVQADRVDVWVGTQNADLALTLAAQASGVKPENVHIHNTFSGGGFRAAAAAR
jgi:isoquinoline 1-oxidoreductase beta subunit